VAPLDEPEIEKTCVQYGARYSPIKHRDPGHMQQIAEKIRADEHCCNPDWICYIDSDCIFTKPAHIDDLFVNGRPILCYDGWEADHTHQWRKGTEFMFGAPIELNFMRRHGMCYKPEHLKGLRWHLGDRYYDWILEQWDSEQEWFPKRSGDKMWQPFGKPKMSEFCLMGAWVWRHHAGDFCWWRVDDFGWPGKDRHGWVKQYWSHGEVTPEVQKGLDAILA